MNDVKAPVVVRSVRQSYGSREVLHGIDLSVEHNSFHCIIGPNGAGKTTLIEIIHGARRPRTGTIRLLGRPHCHETPPSWHESASSPRPPHSSHTPRPGST